MPFSTCPKCGYPETRPIEIQRVLYGQEFRFPGEPDLLNIWQLDKNQRDLKIGGLLDIKNRSGEVKQVEWGILVIPLD